MIGRAGGAHPADHAARGGAARRRLVGKVLFSHRTESLTCKVRTGPKGTGVFILLPDEHNRGRSRCAGASGQHPSFTPARATGTHQTEPRSSSYWACAQDCTGVRAREVQRCRREAPSREVPASGPCSHHPAQRCEWRPTIPPPVRHSLIQSIHLTKTGVNAVATRPGAASQEVPAMLRPPPDDADPSPIAAPDDQWSKHYASLAGLLSEALCAGAPAGPGNL